MFSLIVWLEAFLAIYCTAGLVLVTWYGEWAAIPFQALFALGYGLITYFNVKYYWDVQGSAFKVQG